MAISAKLASALFSQKPEGVPASSHILALPSNDMANAISTDVEAELFAATLSYAEGVRSLDGGNVSWAAVKLYYSVFYCMRTAMLLSDVINFHSKRFYLCDARTGRISTGSSSSHEWSWPAIRGFARLRGSIFSSESENAYARLKIIRESANYKESFPDPTLPRHFYYVGVNGTSKAFRAYRDDGDRILTYLDEHLAFAYPTQTVFETVKIAKDAGVEISPDREAQVRRTWPLRDSPPV